MLRVCLVPLLLSIAACISSPELTLVGEMRDASVSPDGSASAIALVETVGLDAGDSGDVSVDGGVLPHPGRDAGTSDDGDDDDGEEDDDGPGKGKGKPPKKKD